ncbi:hypothetical protein [Latilactobacillus fuchuensis]|nr:hypothetical protein [Latilactobacillus fuchuensis]SPC35893.1 conserved hypothetical protein [Latilactobacillus fuchuensis]
MAIYYLEKKPAVNEIVDSVRASVASLQYFEKMDAICDQIGFSLDDAIVLQRIKEMAAGRYVELTTVEAAGYSIEQIMTFKKAGLLMGMRDTEHAKDYIMLTPKTINGLQAIAATYDNDVVSVPKVNIADVEEMMAAASKVFQKYQ